MANPRVHEVATDLGIDSKLALDTLKGMGEFVKSASSSIAPPVARRLRAKLRADPTVRTIPPLTFTPRVSARLIGQQSGLPRTLPSFVDLLNLGGLSIQREGFRFRIPQEAIAGRHFYFSDQPRDSHVDRVEEKLLPSEHGLAVIQRSNRIELIGWATRERLLVSRCTITRDEDTMVMGNASNAFRDAEEGAYFVNDGKGEDLGVRRLADLVASIPTAPPPSARDNVARPRAELVRVDDEGVKIIYLRRRTPGSSSSGSNDPVKRTTHWKVRGHWRNQWYPSLGAHRRRWISEHSAGPEEGHELRHDIVYVIKPL